MAPIPNITSYSVVALTSSSSSFSSFSDSKSKRKRNVAPINDCLCRYLPIISRGRFFEDSCFENIRAYFNHEFRSMLANWNEAEIKTDAWFRRAIELEKRMNRDRKLKIYTERQNYQQALSITSDDGDCKIIVNVGELMPDEIKVRVVRKDIVAEGRIIIDENKATSSRNPLKNFHYQFVMPESTDMNAITSALSSDGLLTITAPKLVNSSGSSSSLEVPLNKSDVTSKPSIAQGKVTNLNKKRKENIYDVCENCGQNPELHGVKVNQVNNQMNRMEYFHEDDPQYKDKKVVDGVKKATQVTNKMGSKSEIFSIESDEFEEVYFNSENFKGVKDQIRTHEELSAKDEKCSQTFASKDCVLFSSTPSFFKNLPVRIDGSSTESSLGCVDEDFQAVLKTLLSKREKRSIKKSDKEQFCVNNISEVVRMEDHLHYMFAVDVQDFLPDGEINVRSVEGRELTVECQGSDMEISPKLRNSFTEKFTVPEDVLLKSAQATMMAFEGFVIIIAPKKRQMIKVNEHIVPITFEKVESDSQSEKEATRMATSYDQCCQQSSATNGVTSNVDDVLCRYHCHDLSINDVKGVSNLQLNDSTMHQRETFLNQTVNKQESTLQMKNVDHRIAKMENENSDNTKTEGDQQQWHSTSFDSSYLNTSSKNSPVNGHKCPRTSSSETTNDLYVSHEEISERGVKAVSSLDPLVATSNTGNGDLPSFKSEHIASSQTTGSDNKGNEFQPSPQVVDSLTGSYSSDSLGSTATQICSATANEVSVVRTHESENEFEAEMRDELVKGEIGQDQEIRETDMESSVNSLDVFDDEDDNKDEDDDTSCASTVVDIPCCSKAHDKTVIAPETPNLNYSVTLAESPTDLQKSFTWRDIGGKITASSSFGELGRELLHQSSTLSIHTLEDSDVNCDESCNSSVYGLSSYSSVEDYPTLNDDSISMLNLQESSKSQHSRVFRGQTHSEKTNSNRIQKSENRNFQESLENSMRHDSRNSTKQGTVTFANAVEEWIANSCY